MARDQFHWRVAQTRRPGAIAPPLARPNNAASRTSNASTTPSGRTRVSPIIGPTQSYTPSPRAMPRQFPPVWHPDAATMRRASDGGFIKWHQHKLFLTTYLCGQSVALLERPLSSSRLF